MLSERCLLCTRGMRNASTPNVQRLYIFVLALALAPGLAAAQKHTPRSADAHQMIAVQVALDRAGFSPGEIDGRGGPKTRLALSEFQKAAGMQPTGVVNEETLAALRAPAEPLLTYTITPQDVAGPFIDAMPRDMMESAKLPALAYTSALEALSEKFHASPALLRHLNPGAAWAAGETIKVPDVEPFEAKPELVGKTLCVTGRRRAHFRRDEVARGARFRRKGADVRSRDGREQ